MMFPMPSICLMLTYGLYVHCVNYGWKQAKVCDTLSSMHVCPYVHGKVMNIDQVQITNACGNLES